MIIGDNPITISCHTPLQMKEDTVMYLGRRQKSVRTPITAYPSNKESYRLRSCLVIIVFKVFFVWKYIEIIFFLFFKFYFWHHHIKTILKHKKNNLKKKLFFKKFFRMQKQTDSKRWEHHLIILSILLSLSFKSL